MKEHRLIQAMYKDTEIEMEMHQQARGQWRCDYTLIKHPGRSMRIEHMGDEFATFDLARAFALAKAHTAIDDGH
jgi:hypothetical protein